MYGAVIVSESSPRVHTGTVTGSARTFESPSARNRATAQSTAWASPAEPVGRGPKPSQSSASRFQAA